MAMPVSISCFKTGINNLKTNYMKVVVTILMMFCGALVAQAQSGITFDVNSAGIGGYGNVSFSNPTTIGVKAVETIDDADVTGSPYYDSRWRSAVVVLRNNEGMRLSKVRLNLQKSELHYIDSTGTELIANAGLVKKVFFLDAKDTSKIAAVFQQIAGIDDKNPNAFIQVLNTGKAQLLKLTTINLHNRGFDPVSGKNNYTFLSKDNFFILSGGVLNPLKNLDSQEITALLAPSAKETAWLASNKNKLKSEKDVISFLGYYNEPK